MNMLQRFGPALAACAGITALAGIASADAYFSDTFESTLSQWTGKSGGTHHGVIVPDPLRPGNNVLSFTGLNAGGDMFSVTALALDPSATYRISFDYLGLAEPMTIAGDTGGYVGFSQGLPDAHRWLWATGSVSGASDVLDDDAQWHRYRFDFNAAGLGTTSAHLMIEDFSGASGVAGDAYFDNFTITSVPEPAATAMLGLGFLIAMRRRRHES